MRGDLSAPRQQESMKGDVKNERYYDHYSRIGHYDSNIIFYPICTYRDKLWRLDCKLSHPSATLKRNCKGFNTCPL